MHTGTNQNPKCTAYANAVTQYHFLKGNTPTQPMQRKTHSFNSIMFSQNSLNKYQKRIMSICISISIQFQCHKTIVDILVCNIQIPIKRVDWLGPTYPFTFFQWSKSFSISKEQQYTFRFYRPDKFEVQDHRFISI